MHTLQGRKKMLLDGRADLVGDSTYLGGSGGMLPRTFFLYALKSILVDSETNIINSNYT